MDKCNDLKILELGDGGPDRPILRGLKQGIGFVSPPFPHSNFATLATERGAPIEQKTNFHHPSLPMEHILYRDIQVSRGLNYHYYCSPAEDGRPVLLLLHGFPNTSSCWKDQVPFFKQRGYGLVVPDLVGYGGTSSPSNPDAYLSSLISRDLIDILDAENVNQAIAIGHDWGSKVASRLANYYPDRFIGYAFLSVGYQPANTFNDYEAILKVTKESYGYELFGYWLFFSEPDAPKLVEDHMDSFLSLANCKDPKDAMRYSAPVGSLRRWLEADRKTEVVDDVTAEDLEIQKSELMKSGMTGPSCWYLLETSGLSAEDNKNVPQENLSIAKPTFFGGCKRDSIVVPDMQLRNMQPFCTDLTYYEFDTGHWVLREAKNELNEQLLKWIDAL